MGGFFLWSERSLAKYPLMPLETFRSRSNVACLLIAFFHDYVGASFPLVWPFSVSRSTQLTVQSEGLHRN
jgi:hypothetical protein